MIVSSVLSEAAWRSPGAAISVPLSVVLLTVNIESSSRPSSAMTVGRSRRRRRAASRSRPLRRSCLDSM